MNRLTIGILGLLIISATYMIGYENGIGERSEEEDLRSALTEMPNFIDDYDLSAEDMKIFSAAIGQAEPCTSDSECPFLHEWRGFIGGVGTPYVAHFRNPLGIFTIVPAARIDTKGESGKLIPRFLIYHQSRNGGASFIDETGMVFQKADLGTWHKVDNHGYAQRMRAGALQAMP